jgi:tetratricopeptide (TPR) repeat protein
MEIPERVLPHQYKLNEEERMVANKKKDLTFLTAMLKKLDNMLSLTDVVQADRKMLCVLLKTVGENARNISHNSKKVEKNQPNLATDYIRNKYGYISECESDKVKRINNNGIDWDRIALFVELADVINDNTSLSQQIYSIFCNKYSELKEDLIKLRQKILHIIQQELDITSEIDWELIDNYINYRDVAPTIFSGKIDLLVQFLGFFYDQNCLTKIAEIVDRVIKANLNLNKIEDRYYLAYSIGIIGEACKGLSSTIKNLEHTYIFELFEDVRDKFFKPPVHKRLVAQSSEQVKEDILAPLLKDYIPQLEALVYTKIQQALSGTTKPLQLSKTPAEVKTFVKSLSSKNKEKKSEDKEEEAFRLIDNNISFIVEEIKFLRQLDVASMLHPHIKLYVRAHACCIMAQASSDMRLIPDAYPKYFSPFATDIVEGSLAEASVARRSKLGHNQITVKPNELEQVVSSVVTDDALPIYDSMRSWQLIHEMEDRIFFTVHALKVHEHVKGYSVSDIQDFFVKTQDPLLQTANSADFLEFIRNLGSDDVIARCEENLHDYFYQCGWAFFRLARYDWSEKYFQKAINYFDKNPSSLDQSVLARLDLSTTLIKNHTYDRAIEVLQKADSLADKDESTISASKRVTIVADLGNAHTGNAQILSSQDDWKNGRKYYLRALRLLEELKISDISFRLKIELNLQNCNEALSLDSINLNELAEKAKLVSSNDPEIYLLCLLKIINCVITQKKYPEAHKYLAESKTYFSRRKSELKKILASTSIEGRLLFAEGILLCKEKCNYSEAIKLFHEAAQKIEKDNGANIELSDIFRYTAICYTDWSLITEGEERLNYLHNAAAYIVKVESLNSSPIDQLEKCYREYIDACHKIALVFAGNKNFNKAIEWYNEAINTYSKKIQKEDRTLGWLYIDLAYSCSELNTDEKIMQAITYTEEAEKLINSNPGNGSLADTYRNIAIWFSDKKQYNKSIIFMEKALVSRQNLENHSQMIESEATENSQYIKGIKYCLCQFYKKYSQYLEEQSDQYITEHTEISKDYLSGALDYSEKALKFTAEKYNSTITYRHMFFSSSKFATEKQPFGPYSDRLCYSDDPVTLEALECSRIIKKLNS